MDLKNIRSFIPGVLPLAVLILAEMIWGVRVGLFAAVALGFLELAYNLVRFKRLERATIPELVLFSLFALLALFLTDEALNHLMTVFILALLVVMTGVSAFSKHNLLMASAGRYFKNIKMGPWELRQMQQTMKGVFWFLMFYMVLFLAVFFLFPEYIGFMGASGLVLLFVVFFIVEYFRKKQLQKKLKGEEWLPLIDETGKVLGHAPRSVVHNGKTRWLHPVVHLQVIGKSGLWLQKRPLNKLVQPGKWDTAVGGHLAAGEPVELSLKREAAEEIGLEVNGPTVLGRYLWESDLEREMIFAFAQKHDGPLTPHPEELDGGRYWSFQEIEDNLGKDVFTPNFEYEYRLFAGVLKKL